MSAESPRHARSGGPLTVPAQPPSDRTIIDAVSGFINDVKLSSTPTDPKDTIQWARFETADINEPTPEGDNTDISPLLLTLGYGAGVQVWLIPPNGEAQEVLSWRQGTVRVLRILPTPPVGDSFAAKRPLIALCDSASPGPTFCSLSFISIRGGEQVKSIKFKNPILDVLANKRSVVVSFSERFAVFDAGTLEDRMVVTTCYPCPCPLGGGAPANPLALGERWLAYADKKLNQSKRSSGGCESEGVTSYTATVLQAAKSLGKGLRGLGETVAQSLAGGRGASPPHPDMYQPGVVTVIDVEGYGEDDTQDGEEPYEPTVAHFTAHSEPVTALQFDATGMLLVTADRRGHDFHVFRIQPHACHPSWAAVHHLYVLHRGDTTAKVQDIAISPDSRWAAISTLRGTTHVFPISPYGGAAGVRTHTQPRVVNRLSRFHRSAGLPIHGSSSGSPTSDGLTTGAWFANPRLPPYPSPVTVAPHAQLRPSANIATNTITRNSSGRQRLSSLSEDSTSLPLLARARFGASPPARPPAHVALYLMAANGCLLYLTLHPKPAKHVAKDKLCDESPVELEVEQVSQWALRRAGSADLLAPLPASSPLLHAAGSRRCAEPCSADADRWLAQVEIVTHAGPHRRLWMGPQFVFKTYTSSGSSTSLSEADTVEIDTSAPGVARSTPVNMPGVRPILPVFIDSGSASSLEHSPSDSFRRKSLLEAGAGRAPVCDVQLREDLAEAMKEDHGRSCKAADAEGAPRPVARVVDPLGTVVPERGPPPPPPPPPRPLPRDTTIPVQSLPPGATPASPGDSVPLTSDVIIPAQCFSLPDPVMYVVPSDSVEYADVVVNEVRLEEAQVVRQRHAEEFEEVLGDDTSGRRAEVAVERRGVKVKLDIKVEQVEEVETVNEETVVEMKPPEVKVREVKKAEKAIKEPSPPVEPRPAKESTPTEKARPVKEVSPPKEFRPAKELTPPAAAPRLAKQHSPPKESRLAKEYSPPVETRLRKEVTPHAEPKIAKELSPPKEPSPAKELTPPKDIPEETSVVVTMKLPTKARDAPKHKRIDDEIKTEEQAWDLLLNEPDKPVTVETRPVLTKKVEEPKFKPRRNRKNRKAHDETAKTDDDNFVEIHAIEDKNQESSGDLVSISPHFDDSEAAKQYIAKQMPKSPKNESTERVLEADLVEKPIAEDTFDVLSKERSPFRKYKRYERDSAANDLFPSFKDSDLFKDADFLLPTTHSDDTYSETASMIKETAPHSKKCKSLPPFLDATRKHDRAESKCKDLIYIDTTRESFPDIQVTRASKPRADAPKEQITEKPIKSWSSIAACKSKKEATPEPVETVDESFKEISLQDKLIEICKRADIMVAECDAPARSFTEGHGIPELAPLDMDFGLDQFRFDAMKDSLLEEVQGSSRMNIEDIFTSFKEAKADCGHFDLLSFDKRAPPVKEEEVEKSSDDNESPVVSTDSDKDDKRLAGASNILLPSTKQSAKSKKSRKKKK